MRGALRQHYDTMPGGQSRRAVRRTLRDDDLFEMVVDAVDASDGEALSAVVTGAQTAEDGTPVVDAILKLIKGLIDMMPAIIAIIEKLLPLFAV